jgi:hypothetical protein
MIDVGLVYVQLVLGVGEDVCQTICVRFWDIEYPFRYAGRGGSLRNSLPCVAYHADELANGFRLKMLILYHSKI